MPSPISPTCTSIDCDERLSVCCGAKPRELMENGERTGNYICSACLEKFWGGECDTQLAEAERAYLESLWGGETGKDHLPTCTTPETHKTCYEGVTLTYDTSCHNSFHEELLSRMAKHRLPFWVKIVVATLVSVALITFIYASTTTLCADALRSIISPS